MLYLRTDGPRHWRLTRAYAYVGSWETFTVPAGFRTDLASTPRVIWALFPPFGTYSEAAVLHDWILSRSLATPYDAHRIFRRKMLEDGTPAWQARAMYAAVVLYSRWRGD